MLKFTQQVKDNWLENLKSGKYKQGFTTLFSKRDDSFCCIGVLGDCTEGLISDSGKLNNLNRDSNPYLFLEKSVGRFLMEDLWRANDAKNRDLSYARDYSNVISLIEALPVQE